MYKPKGTYDIKEIDAGMREYMEQEAGRYIFELWHDSYPETMNFLDFLNLLDFEVKYYEKESGCCRVDAYCELWINDELEASWMRNICR